MKRSALLLAFGCLFGLATRSSAALPIKPNIIFILADDYGTGEVGCYGADHYKTPNLDALARGGTRYTNAYTVPLCGPSRAMILTGRYPFRTGATNQDATGTYSPKDWTMMPKVLKNAGYITSAVGKWGQLPLGPGEFGFDDYLKFQGSGAYWNTQDKAKTYDVNGKKIPLPDKVYLPDVMHQHVTNFITTNRDMSEAPFAEKPVPTDSKDPAAIAARKRLQGVLKELNPAGGIVDTGDPSGRHAKNVAGKKNRKED